MLYQLPNGKTIEIPTELYLDMTDEDLEYFIATNFGENIEDPWFGSVLSGSSPKQADTNDLTDIPAEEKLTDPEVNPED
jgi:hypothetical protein